MAADARSPILHLDTNKLFSLIAITDCQIMMIYISILILFVSSLFTGISAWNGIPLPPLTPANLSLYPVYPMVQSSLHAETSMSSSSVGRSIHTDGWFPVSHTLAFRESHRYHNHLAMGPYPSTKTPRNTTSKLIPAPSLVR